MKLVLKQVTGSEVKTSVLLGASDYLRTLEIIAEIE